MRAVHLNMTTSLGGFIAGPHGQLGSMTTAHDAELTTTSSRSSADVAQDLAVADTHFFVTSRPP